MANDEPELLCDVPVGLPRRRPARRRFRPAPSSLGAAISAAVGPFPACGGVGPARCPTVADACPHGSMACVAVPDVPLGGEPAFDQSSIGTEEAARGAIVGPRELSPLVLRYFLTLTMVDAGGEVTVQELGSRLHDAGCAVAGRTSKVISDSLRWEIRRGRVLRTGRGRYVASRVPRSTLAWMRNRLAEEVAARPRPVRAWPVGGFRVGWNARARGRDLAVERKARTRRARAACRAHFDRTWHERRSSRVPLHPEPGELLARIAAGEIPGHEPEHVAEEDDRSLEVERLGASRPAMTARVSTRSIGSLDP